MSDLNKCLAVGELENLLNQSKLSSFFQAENVDQNKAIVLFGFLAYDLVLEKHKAEYIVPGLMACVKCKFTLSRNNIYLKSGTVEAGDSEITPCPNGCGDLHPVTWKVYANENLELADRFFTESQAHQAEVEKLRAATPSALKEKLRSAEERIGELESEQYTLKYCEAQWQADRSQLLEKLAVANAEIAKLKKQGKFLGEQLQGASYAILDMAKQSTPAQIAKDTGVFFSYDGDVFIEWPSIEEAKEAAENDIEHYRENAADWGWSHEVENVVYGIVLGKAEETMRRPSTPEDGCNPDHDTVVDYGIVDLVPEVQ